MAGIPSAIFLSYAHADNLGGWVNAFHAGLQNWLGVLGVKATIWRDRKLGGADVFSDEILDQLKQSVLLVSILSPNGMASNWCEKERQKADRDAHRPVFGTIGYEFFEKDPQSGRYDHYLPSEDRFCKRVDRLAQGDQGHPPGSRRGVGATSELNTDDSPLAATHNNSTQK